MVFGHTALCLYAASETRKEFCFGRLLSIIAICVCDQCYGYD